MQPELRPAASCILYCNQHFSRCLQRLLQQVCFWQPPTMLCGEHHSSLLHLPIQCSRSDPKAGMYKASSLAMRPPVQVEALHRGTEQGNQQCSGWSITSALILKCFGQAWSLRMHTCSGLRRLAAFDHPYCFALAASGSLCAQSCISMIVPAADKHM